MQHARNIKPTVQWVARGPIKQAEKDTGKQALQVQQRPYTIHTWDSYSTNSSTQFAFTTIYGLHTIAHRCALRDALRDLDPQINSPWLIMGDFNAILDIDERVNGTVVQENEVKDFRALMEDCRLTELATMGRSYTWINNHVYSRINRAFVNVHWMLNMPLIQVNVMDPHFLDNSPSCIELETTMGSRRKPFKFYKCLANHPEFGTIVQEGWYNREGSMRSIWKKLKSMKAALKGLNRKEFEDTTKKVQQLEEQLASIQA
ncbi:PREDICTED: uncharacterized protein LOC109240107 [Nicotiana attenuata]|uniref:uncharacterized protein LOC109240107 n=1 Tax=Nicotiana attenuata TaxID=49451 RepID=UPI000904A04C|nr:PREDICTED: uncharacterized protein LOC109240107 [Nicotiana attenuata]